MIDSRWNRWIYASFSKFFSTKISPSYPYLVEGQAKEEIADRVEFRLTGPTWTQTSRRTWYGSVVINILVKAMKDSQDFHKVFKMVGVVEKAFEPCIPIMTYGESSPASKIADFQQVREANRDIETIHFGQVADDLPLLQSTVEATYRGFIDSS